jgi:urea transport system substrate-binding protein
MPVKIGILHSLTGPMAASERPLVSMAQLAVDRINRGGGIIGRRIETIVEDGKSTPPVFAERAEKLIKEDKVEAVFGCWTSSSRKAVMSVVEKYHSLLWYPIQYEGLAESPNIIYTGSCLNQQVCPAVDWAFSQGYRRFFLLGSDYMYPRTANSLIKCLVHDRNGSIAAEEYVPLESHDFKDIGSALCSTDADIIFSTINGDGNCAFLKEYTRRGLCPETLPVMSFSFSEVELSQVPDEGRGHYACWNYFGGLNTKENESFKKELHKDGITDIPLSAPIIAAYMQVMLWRQIVEQIKSTDPQTVIANSAGTVYHSPEGKIEILKNHHVKHRAYIGRANSKAQFDIVWSSPPIPPKPWLGLEDADLEYGSLIHEAMEQFPLMLDVNAQLRSEIQRSEILEEQLRERNLKMLQLTQAIDQSPVSVIITDLKGNVVYVNPYFHELTGYTCEEIIGKNPRILRSGKTPPERYEKMWDTIRAGKTWRGEFLNKKKNGELYWELAIISSVRDEEGKILNYIGVKNDITKRKQAEFDLKKANKLLKDRLETIMDLQKQLKEQAIRDPLSNLYNRRFLLERIDNDFEMARRNKQPLSIAMLDIDLFKSINDAYGHFAGDAAIQALAKLLQKELRKTDLICRYGGDEFMVVLFDCDPAKAMSVIENIRRIFNSDSINSENTRINLSLSAGISTFPADGDNFENVLARADAALYFSKNNGRNMATAWTKGIDKKNHSTGNDSDFCI